MPRGPATPFVLLAVASTALLSAFPGNTRAQSGVPPLSHVVVLMMENQGYHQAANQPYMQSLMAQGVTFTHSYALTHPSQPNYLALWCGAPLETSDLCPVGPYLADNLGSECEAFGLAWRSYAEDLPFVGADSCRHALYVRRHCPWTNFGNLNHDYERPFEHLANDLANDSLPQLAFVIPNLCHDTHDCALDVGDQWLAAHVPAILDALGPQGLLIVTYDEDDHSGLNHILTVFVGPTVQAGQVCEREITHYSVLRTITDALRLPPLGGAQADSAITGVWTPFTATPPAPLTLRLSAPAPNPSRGGFHAWLALDRPAQVDARLLDVAGRTVRTIVNGERDGVVRLDWDGLSEHGARVRAGRYFLDVRSGVRRARRGVIVLP